MQRLLPPILVLILITTMVAMTRQWPWPELPAPARLAGIVPVAAGLVIGIRHARIFSRVGTNIHTFNDPDILIVEGAFRWTRNPIYLGFTLLLIGIAVALGSLIALAGPIVFLAAADRWYIPFEEERMARTFGNDYHEYKRHVRRWIGTTTS